MAWKSPIGFVDPDTQWINETNVYDENTGTYGYDDITSQNWSSLIELTIGSISCDKIRYFAGGEDADINQINVDVYYSGAWHDVYSGAFTHGVWEEKSLGGTYNVTAMRVSFHNSNAAWARMGYLYETEFNELTSEQKQLSESFSITDSLVKNATEQLAEAFSIVDSWVARLSFSEAFSITDSLVKNATEQLAETLSIIDSWVSRLNFAEAFSIVDAYVARKIWGEEAKTTVTWIEETKKETSLTEEIKKTASWVEETKNDGVI